MGTGIVYPHLSVHEELVKRIQKSFLASGSTYFPLPPICQANSGYSGFRPRLQRRVRDGISPSSLFLTIPVQAAG